MLLAFCIDQRVKLQLVLFVACAKCKKKEKKQDNASHVIILITKLVFVVFRHLKYHVDHSGSYKCSLVACLSLGHF